VKFDDKRGSPYEGTGLPGTPQISGILRKLQRIIRVDGVTLAFPLFHHHYLL
jgi:hypothetical protein